MGFFLLLLWIKFKGIIFVNFLLSNHLDKGIQGNDVLLDLFSDPCCFWFLLKGFIKILDFINFRNSSIGFILTCTFNKFSIHSQVEVFLVNFT